MRRLLPVAVLAILAPLAGAEPDFAASRWDHFEGTLVEGEVDTHEEWIDAWYPDGLSCATSIGTQLMRLHLEGAADTDIVRLDGWTWRPVDTPGFATATSDAYVYHQTPCSSDPHFTISGTSVAGMVRYVLDIQQCPVHVELVLFGMCPVIP